MSGVVDAGFLSPLRNTIRAMYTVPPFIAEHAWRSRYVERRHVPVTELSEVPPEHRSHPHLQPRVGGVGPVVMRTYCVDIADPVVDAVELMDEFRTDPNHFTSSLVAGFVRDDEPARDLVEGDDVVVELPGPWNGPCTIDTIGDTSVLMATLDGHMEAGHIRFETIHPPSHSADGFSFRVRSWARAGDAGFAALHVGVPIGKELQTAMWCAMCDRAVTISGGQRSSPISVSTEELDGSDRSAN